MTEPIADNVQSANIDELYASLTLKQKKFVDYYFETGGNATVAAERAGYADNSDVSLRVQGHRNITNANINEVIQARYKQSIMSADELLSRITSTARMDLGPYIDKYGRLAGVDIDRLIADGHGHLIRGIKHTKHGSEIVFKDAQRAQDQLLKFYGLDKTETNVNVDNRHVSITYVTENRPADDGGTTSAGRVIDQVPDDDK